MNKQRNPVAQKEQTYSVININNKWLERAGRLIVRHQVNHQLNEAGQEAARQLSILFLQILPLYEQYLQAVHETEFDQAYTYLLPLTQARLNANKRAVLEKGMKLEAGKVLDYLRSNISIINSHWQEMSTAGPVAAAEIHKVLRLLEGQAPAQLEEEVGE